MPDDLPFLTSTTRRALAFLIEFSCLEFSWCGNLSVIINWRDISEFEIGVQVTFSTSPIERAECGKIILPEVPNLYDEKDSCVSHRVLMS